MKASTLAGCLFAACFFTPLKAQDVAQQVRHWWVECDRNLYCKAETNGQSAGNEQMSFRLERRNEPNSPIFVTVAPERSLTAGLRIEFDIHNVINGISGTVGNIRDGNAASFSERRESVLIESLRKGSTGVVRVFFGGAQGSVAYEVSLEGVTDALTIMDIVQKRLGRVDAAVAWGPLAADSLSDIFPDSGKDDDENAGADTHLEDGPNGSYIDLLVEAAKIPDQVLMYGYRVFDCPDFEQAISSNGVLLNRDETGRMAYIVPCNVGKANVHSYVVMHDPANGIEYEIMEFELPPAMNKPNRATVLNPVWNAYDQTMTITRFANINRNCGAYEIHNWISDGNFFELVQYREKTECGGPQVQPQDFPLSWTIEEMGD